MMRQPLIQTIDHAGLDLDEVILDFNRMALERFNEKYGQKVKLEDITSFDWYRTFFGISLEQFYKDLNELDVCVDARPYDGAREAIERLMSQGSKVTIITSRGFLHNANAVTETWLAKHGIPYDRLQVVGAGRTKSEYFDRPVDLFVDDHLKNHADMIGAGMSKRNVVISTGYNHPTIAESQGIREHLEYHDSLFDFVSGL